MALEPTSRGRFNLDKATILMLEGSGMGMDILVQIVTGLGAKSLHRCQSVEEAQDTVKKTKVDLIIADALSPAGEGYEFVAWLRKSAGEPNCFAPVVVTAAHTPVSMVQKARDCGAHYIVKKPLTPVVMLERILWIARESRPFIEAPSYVGPDRRHKNEGPPNGTPRRHDDLPAEVGLAQEPNMSQDEVDNLMSARKVSL
ncbi:MAG: response regulator [Caulobacteraceae bacterium]|nr:response regulator [Caulobacteraceae bacterium]MDX5392977.1 response regulator [Caulobacteraceae bacterium]